MHCTKPKMGSIPARPLLGLLPAQVQLHFMLKVIGTYIKPLQPQDFGKNNSRNMSTEAHQS